jgi:hypothetical protein
VAISDGLRTLVGLFRDISADMTRSREREVSSPRPGKDNWHYNYNEWDGYPDQKLPGNCPINVLGVQGDVMHVVDTLGQIISVPASKRKPEVLFDLFKGHSNFVFHHWPQVNKDGPVFSNVEARQAWNCLLNVAARQGLFDPIDKVRGRGGWAAGRQSPGLFVWHAGDAVFVVHDGELKQRDPGMLGGKFYAAAPGILAPWQDEIPIEDSPGPQVLKHLMTWRFQRRELDAVLLLGAIGCAFYSGALEQRPFSMIVGDRGVGKSSLIGMEGHGFIKALLGDAMLDAGNASEAGIVQILGQDSRPIALDEFEQKADNNQRANQLIEMIRQMYSGSLRVRGGQDHKGTKFRLQSPVFAAAINPPQFEAQDYSRMAIFNLDRFAPGTLTSEFPHDPHQTGRMLLRRLMDGWQEFNGHLVAWRKVFRLAGLDARFGDTFGTLLASAQTLLGDAGMEDAGLPVTAGEEQLGEWMREKTAYERSLISDNWRNCLEHLLAQTIVAWTNGNKPTVGAVLKDHEAGHMDTKAVRERFACAGLGIIDLEDGRAKKLRDALFADAEFARRHEDRRTHYLFAVPHKGPSLNALFSGTKWRDGAWTRTLRQAPAHVVLTGPDIPPHVKIGRVLERCTIIDLAGYDREATGAEQEDVIDG